MSEKNNEVKKDVPFGARVGRAVSYGMGMTAVFFLGFGALAGLGIIATAQVPYLATLFGFSMPLGIEFGKVIGKE